MRLDNMRRISICQFSTFRWSFLEDVVRYATLGFDSIGIWRRKIDDFGHDAAADLLYESKLSVSSLHWAGGFTGDGQSFADAIEDAIESIQLASRLNAGCLIIHPGSRNGHTTSNANRLFRSALTHLMPIAADYGVKLAIEPIPEKRCSPWTFIESFHDSLALLDQFPERDLGLNLDLYHVGFNSEIFERLEQYVDRIALVQLADANLSSYQEHGDRETRNESYRIPLGQGELPLENWLTQLQQLGYTGRFELEVHGAAIESDEYYSLLESTHEFFANETIEQLVDVRPQNALTKRYQLDRKN